MKKTQRTDPHRPGAIVPGEYEYVFSYSGATMSGGHPIPSWGVNCEMDRRTETKTPEGKTVITNGKHNLNGLCCIIGMGVAGHRFAEQGCTCQCSICGTAYVYGDVWKHLPSGEHIHVGHNCADKYSMLADRSKFELGRMRREAAAAVQIQKARNDEERKEFLDAHPGLEADLAIEHRIITDIAQKFVQYRSLSDKQIAFVHKLAEEVRNPAPPKPEEQHVPAPEGRLMVRGVVLSVKSYASDYGDTLKMLVKVTTPAGIWLAWGTVPSALLSGEGALRGSEVEFSAELRRGKDAHFALYKRPTQASIVSQVVDHMV